MNAPFQDRSRVGARAPQANAVRSALRERRRNAADALLAAAISLTSVGGFGFLSRMFMGFGGHHSIGTSRRSAKEIAGELRNFYGQRPRPWLSPNARGRLARVARRRAHRSASH